MYQLKAYEKSKAEEQAIHQGSRSSIELKYQNKYNQHMKGQQSDAKPKNLIDYV